MDEGWPSQPTWSPDGTHLAYHWTPNVPDGYPSGLTGWIVAIAGGEPQRLLTPDGEDAANLDWSPNGSRIVYSTIGAIVSSRATAPPHPRGSSRSAPTAPTRSCCATTPTSRTVAAGRRAGCPTAGTSAVLRLPHLQPRGRRRDRGCPHRPGGADLVRIAVRAGVRLPVHLATGAVAHGAAEVAGRTGGWHAVPPGLAPSPPGWVQTAVADAANAGRDPARPPPRVRGESPWAST